jgi:hypothetical protein
MKASPERPILEWSITGRKITQRNAMDESGLKTLQGCSAELLRPTYLLPSKQRVYERA